jgi:hypothetical protein
METAQQLVESFQTIVPRLTEEQRAGLVQIIDQRIEQTMNYAQRVASLIESGLTQHYRQLWENHLDEKSVEVNTLKELKGVLENYTG